MTSWTDIWCIVNRATVLTIVAQWTCLAGLLGLGTIKSIADPGGQGVHEVAATALNVPGKEVKDVTEKSDSRPLPYPLLYCRNDFTSEVPRSTPDADCAVVTGDFSRVTADWQLVTLLPPVQATGAPAGSGQALPAGHAVQFSNLPPSENIPVGHGTAPQIDFCSSANFSP
ncbi:hypothetical protein P5673_009367 [Acropora cervicornis]|uniref:Uncharacterized protein n=1 Tax=Acropora cervicornis TaxID=6130 RepID=A0AAD9QSR8_ACRCE|nr:hypothetical protein P5673_009367 [Acropora cervicornis]